MALIEDCYTFSVWQRKTVPTVRVHPATDELPGVQMTRLQELIDSAPHFTKILLVGGTYNEQILVNKAIELCGEEDDEPTIQSRGPTITVSSDVPCFFANLKVKVKSIIQQQPGSTRTDPPAVTMTTGKAVFFRCEMTSVYVAGNAQPVIERCLIQGNLGGSGLLVRDSASGRYLTNEISDHSLYCIEVTSKGTPQFVNNDVHTNPGQATAVAGAGLLRVSGGGAGSLAMAIHGEVAPTFIGNKFQDQFTEEQRNHAQAMFSTDKRRVLFSPDLTNQRVALAIEYANPKFEQNIVDGGIIAMSLVGGQGTYTSNTIQLSILCGLFVSRGCQATFDNCKIAQHSGGGVFIDGCSPSIINSSVVQCRGVAVSVNNSKDFWVQKCLLEKSRVGISVVGHSVGSILENQIQRNEMIGVRLCDQGTRTKVRDNIIQMNSGCGIYVANLAEPLLEGNTVHSQKAGMMVANGAFPTVLRNKIYGNEQFGVTVQDASRGLFQKNRIANGATAAIRVSDRSAPRFEENQIEDATVGVLNTTRSFGTFVKNAFRGHGDGLNITSGADPYIEENTFNNCTRYGCFAFEDGLGTLVNNTFATMMIGLGSFKGSETVFRGNVVENSMQAGCVLGEGSRSLLEKNAFNETKGHGLVITGYRSHSRVTRCTFSHNQGFGVLSEKQGGGIVEHCFFTANISAGLGSEDDGDTLFRFNRSLEDIGPGILVSNGGCGRFFSNVVEEGRTVGCRITARGRPLIQGGKFLRCTAVGIDLTADAEGEFVDCEVDACRIGIAAKGANCRSVLTGVAITHCTECGVGLGDDVAVALEKCTIADQAVGLRLSACGEATMTECVLLRNDRGVVCEKGGQAVLTNCRVAEGNTSLLEFNESGHCSLKSCVLEDSIGIGVHIKGKSRGYFLETKILRCLVVGVMMENHAEPTFEFCMVSECRVGITLQNQSAGHFQETSCLENIDHNVICTQRSTTTFTKCLVAISKEGCGIVCKSDLCKFTDCQIQRNHRHGLLAETGSRVQLRGCHLVHNHMSGVYCCPRAEPSLHSSKILDNVHCGSFLLADANPSMTEVEICDNADGGVVCQTGSKGVFQRCVLRGNFIGNVRVLQGSETLFKENSIVQGKPCGVVIQGSNATFDGNQISQCSHSGVYVAGPSECSLIHNTIFSNQNGIVFEAAGVCMFQAPISVDPNVVIVDEWASPSAQSTTFAATHTHRRTKGKGKATKGHSSGSSAMVTTNAFHSNTHAGISMLRHCNPTIVQNTFSDGEIGVFVKTMAEGSVEHNTFRANRVGLHILGNLIETKIRLNTFQENIIGIDIHFNNRTSPAVAGRGYSPSEQALKGNKLGKSMSKAGKQSLLSSIAALLDEAEANETAATASVGDEGGALLESSGTEDDDEDSRSSSSSVNSGGSAGGGGGGDGGATRKGATADASSTIRITTVVLRNRFLENKTYGIFVADGSETQITQNEFSGELCGVGGGTGAAATVADNVFNRCSVGIHLAQQTNFKVTRNQFADSNELGIYCSGGTGEVTRNTFTLCIVAGVCVESSGAPNVSRNLFAYNTATALSAGIYTRRNGGGFFSDNDIHENSIGIRCDHGGLGTVTNSFLHDNAIGLQAMFGGKCTVSQSFFTENRIADVFSCYGGAPILNRCVLYDCVKPFLIRDFGAGIFSFNVVKNVEGSAVLLQFPLMKDYEARVAEAENQRKRELDSHEIGKHVLSNEGTIHRGGLGQLGVIDQKPMRKIYRVSPTFSSNLFCNCGAGIEVDLGEVPKDRFTRGGAGGPSKRASSASSDSHEKAGGGEKDVVSGAPKPKGARRGTTVAAASAAVGGATSSASTTGASGQTKSAASGNYVCPLPDLQTIQRGDYWGFFTQNVIQQCVSGIVVHKGPTERPPKFRALFEGGSGISSGGDQAEDGAVGVLSAGGRGAAPSMEEFESESSPKTAVAMVDDVFMCYFDGNTISNNDVGVTLRHGGNARFERNFICKSMRTGILVSEEGRGEFYENVVTDTPTGYCVNVLGDQTRGALSASIPPCYANFQWNVFSGGKTCVMVSAPEVRFHKNRIYGGEQGLNIASAAGGLFHLNIIYENRKVGCICMSDSVVLYCNWFTSPLESSAIEMKIELPGATNRVPQSNSIKNQFTPRLAKPEPATKISLQSDHVSEAKSAKEQKELFDALKILHESQLPSCGSIGCSRIGVYASRHEHEEFEAARRRALAQRIEVTEEGIQQVKVSSSDKTASGSTATVSSRGVQIVEPSQAKAPSATSGDGADAFFGSLQQNTGATFTGNVFRASSSRFGRQSEGGLLGVTSSRPSKILTIEELRNEARTKREERSRKKSNVSMLPTDSVSKRLRRKSSMSSKARNSVAGQDDGQTSQAKDSSPNSPAYTQRSTTANSPTTTLSQRPGAPPSNADAIARRGSFDLQSPSSSTQPSPRKAFVQPQAAGAPPAPASTAPAGMPASAADSAVQDRGAPSDLATVATIVAVDSPTDAHKADPQCATAEGSPQREDLISDAPHATSTEADGGHEPTETSQQPQQQQQDAKDLADEATMKEAALVGVNGGPATTAAAVATISNAKSRRGRASIVGPASHHSPPPAGVVLADATAASAGEASSLPPSQAPTMMQTKSFSKGGAARRPTVDAFSALAAAFGERTSTNGIGEGESGEDALSKATPRTSVAAASARLRGAAAIAALASSTSPSFIGLDARKKSTLPSTEGDAAVPKISPQEQAARRLESAEKIRQAFSTRPKAEVGGGGLLGVSAEKASGSQRTLRSSVATAMAATSLRNRGWRAAAASIEYPTATLADVNTAASVNPDDDDAAAAAAYDSTASGRGEATDASVALSGGGGAPQPAADTREPRGRSRESVDPSSLMSPEAQHAFLVNLGTSAPSDVAVEKEVTSDEASGRAPAAEPAAIRSSAATSMHLASKRPAPLVLPSVERPVPSPVTASGEPAASSRQQSKKPAHAHSRATVAQAPLVKHDVPPRSTGQVAVPRPKSPAQRSSSSASPSPPRRRVAAEPTTTAPRIPSGNAERHKAHASSSAKPATALRSEKEARKSTVRATKQPTSSPPIEAKNDATFPPREPKRVASASAVTRERSSQSQMECRKEQSESRGSSNERSGTTNRHRDRDTKSAGAKISRAKTTASASAQRKGFTGFAAPASTPAGALTEVLLEEGQPVASESAIHRLSQATTPIVNAGVEDVDGPAPVLSDTRTSCAANALVPTLDQPCDEVTLLSSSPPRADSGTSASPAPPSASRELNDDAAQIPLMPTSPAPAPARTSESRRASATTQHRDREIPAVRTRAASPRSQEADVVKVPEKSNAAALIASPPIAPASPPPFHFHSFTFNPDGEEETVVLSARCATAGQAQQQRRKVKSPHSLSHITARHSAQYRRYHSPSESAVHAQPEMSYRLPSGWISRGSGDPTPPVPTRGEDGRYSRPWSSGEFVTDRAIKSPEEGVANVLPPAVGSLALVPSPPPPAQQLTKKPSSRQSKTRSPQICDPAPFSAVGVGFPSSRSHSRVDRVAQVGGTLAQPLPHAFVLRKPLERPELSPRIAPVRLTSPPAALPRAGAAGVSRPAPPSSAGGDGRHPNPPRTFLPVAVPEAVSGRKLDSKLSPSPTTHRLALPGMFVQSGSSAAFIPFVSL